MRGKKVVITRNGIWSGTGTWDGETITDCPALLGPDQDASDETYELLADELCELSGSAAVSVERPDGVYVAELSER